MKIVLDIGAWCGTWAKAIEPFAEKVIAFEPTELYGKVLKWNIETNYASNVINPKLKHIWYINPPKAMSSLNTL